MKYAIVYSSRTGNTKLLAETAEKVLPKADCVYCGTPDNKALEADRIYLGFWTDKGVCNQEIADFIQKLSKQEIFLFGTAGFGGSIDYFDKIVQQTRKLLPKETKFIASYMCQGKMPGAVRERYLKMKEENAPVPNIDFMIKNFDIASTHPDKRDLDNFGKFLKDM